MTLVRKDTSDCYLKQLPGEIATRGFRFARIQRVYRITRGPRPIFDFEAARPINERCIWYARHIFKSNSWNEPRRSAFEDVEVIR
jgi:hypothetical protein